MDRRDFLAAAAAAPFLLRSSESLARARGGTPLALVTADTQESLVAVHLGSGRIVRRIATLPRPRSIESVRGTTAVVAHSEDGAVTIVDGRHYAVRRVLRDFAEPRYTAMSPDGRYAYVTDSARAELVTLDLARARVIRRTELGGPARHLGIDPAGRRLWVSLGNKAPALAVLSLADRLAAQGPRLKPEHLERHEELCTQFLCVSRGLGPHPAPDYAAPEDENSGASDADVGYAASYQRLLEARGKSEVAR
jgi:hypothetical protein